MANTLRAGRTGGRRAAAATPAKRRKPTVKQRTITISFQLPEREVQDAQAEALLELANYRTGVKRSVTIT